jgi:hypothetical protein
MLRQYRPGRHRNETIRGRDRAVGTIPIGTLFRLQAVRAGRPNTHIVEAWLTRPYFTGQRSRPVTSLAHGAHVAQVRNLANGRRHLLADHIILRAMED